jgi:hypothetical protein
MNDMIETLRDLATSDPVQFATLSFLTVLVGAPTLRLTAWSVGGVVRKLWGAVIEVRHVRRDWRRDEVAWRADEEAVAAVRRREAARAAETTEDERLARVLRGAMEAMERGRPMMTAGLTEVKAGPISCQPVDWGTVSSRIIYGDAGPVINSRSGRTPQPGEVRPGDRLRFTANGNGAKNPDDSSKDAKAGDLITVSKCFDTYCMYSDNRGTQWCARYQDLVFA